jgi:phosphoadenosine phosphosulfate reductase
MEFFGKLEEESIILLKQFEPPDGYFLAFSGGKDSIVIHSLAEKAKVKFEAHYNLTTVDPPELIYFIRNNYPNVIIDRPQKTMWQLLKQHYGVPPFRQARYCCRELKERGGENRVVITGIRAEESFKRSKREEVEECRDKSKNKIFVHPIISWSEKDVWKYIRENKLAYCKLYDEGFKRIGCILCPFHTKKQTDMDIKKWPKIANLYKKTICRNYDPTRKSSTFKNGEEMFNFWISRKGKVNKKEEKYFLDN